jgi:hypothetical protein
MKAGRFSSIRYVLQKVPGQDPNTPEDEILWEVWDKTASKVVSAGLPYDAAKKICDGLNDPQSVP